MEHNFKLHIVNCGKYLHLTKANPLGDDKLSREF